MAIDHTIYQNQRSATPFGSYQDGKAQGMNMREMADQRAKREATKQAFASSMVQNPDGSTSFDSGLAMKNLAGINPEMAYQIHQNEVAQRAAKQKAERERKAYEVDQMARALDGVGDEMSFQKTKSLLEARGLKTDVLGPKYDPVRIQGLKRAAVPYQELIKNRYKERELGQKDKQLEIDAKKARNANLMSGLKPTEFNKAIEKKSAGTFEKRLEGMSQLEKNLTAVDDALMAQSEYSRDSMMGGTGKIASWGGVKKYVDSDLQDLNAKLKIVNLKNMAENFAGMSKAVDSDAERRAWEGTQADIENDDPVNMEILLGQKSMLLKEKAETMAQKNYVEANGTLAGYESPVYGKVATAIAPSGELVLVEKSEMDKAMEQGFMGIDEFIKKALRQGTVGIEESQAGEPVKTYKTNEIEWMD